MGRPKKNKTESDKPKTKRLSLKERQEINLKKHKERLDKKKDILAKRSEEKFYCKNKDFYNELVAWKKTVTKDNPSGKLTDKLCLTIQNIAKKLTNHSNFSGYSNDIKEEMVSFATYRAINGLIKGNFNFKFENPFGYFTQVCWNSFLIVLGKYYKNINLQRDLVKQKLSELESLQNIDQRKLYNDFIKQYLGSDPNEKNDSDQDSDSE